MCSRHGRGSLLSLGILVAEWLVWFAAYETRCAAVGKLAPSPMLRSALASVMEPTPRMDINAFVKGEVLSGSST
jgi:hypothetical protein